MLQAWTNLTGAPVALHIHTGGAAGTANGPFFVAFNIPVGATQTGNIPTTTFNFLPMYYAQYLANASNLYFNVHTATNPSGEIRGNCTFSQFNKLIYFIYLN